MVITSRLQLSKHGWCAWAHRALREGRRFEPCQVHFAFFFFFCLPSLSQSSLFRVLKQVDLSFYIADINCSGIELDNVLLSLLQGNFVIMVGVQHSPSKLTQVSIYRWTSSGYYCTRKKFAVHNSCSIKSKFVSSLYSDRKRCRIKSSPPSRHPASIRTSSGNREEPHETHNSNSLTA